MSANPCRAWADKRNERPTARWRATSSSPMRSLRNSKPFPGLAPAWMRTPARPSSTDGEFAPSAIVGIVTGYATVNVLAGIGGPGGTSYELGWNIGGQEYGYADLLYALGQTKTTAWTSKPAMDAASAKALAGNGANVWEANHGAGFNAVDGHIVSVGDADYAAQVAALNAAFPPVADTPAPAPVDPGTGPFGSPGIG